MEKIEQVAEPGTYSLAYVNRLAELAARAITSLDVYGSHLAWCEMREKGPDAKCNCDFTNEVQELRQLQEKEDAFGRVTRTPR